MVAAGLVVLNVVSIVSFQVGPNASGAQFLEQSDVQLPARLLRHPPAHRPDIYYIVLDEYADLTSDPDDKTRIEALLRRLTQKARGAGIHVIAATQRPSADVISTTIRSNLPAQLALRVKTATDSRIILDEGGAEALAGQGDALLRTARGLQRLQVAWAN